MKISKHNCLHSFVSAILVCSLACIGMACDEDDAGDEDDSEGAEQCDAEVQQQQAAGNQAALNLLLELNQTYGLQAQEAPAEAQPQQTEQTCPQVQAQQQPNQQQMPPPPPPMMDGGDDGMADGGMMDAGMATGGGSDDSGSTDGSDTAAPPVYGDPISASLTHPALTRLAAAADELTTTISHNGDSAQCSNDNGATWNPCTTLNSYQWNIADKTETHKVRVFKDDAEVSPVELSFVPGDEVPAVSTAYTCTQNVTSDESFNTFNARLTAGEVVCISDGVLIDNDTSAGEGNILLADSGVVIILVREGDTATIANTDINVYESIYVDPGALVLIFGLTVTGSPDHDAVYIDDGGQAFIYYSTLTSGLSGLFNAGGSGALYFTEATATNTTVGSGQHGLLVEDGGVMISVYQSKLTSHAPGGAGIWMDQGSVNSVTFTDIISHDGPAIHMDDFYAANTLSLNSSRVICLDTDSPCVYWDNAVDGSALTFTSNTFVLDSDFGATEAFIYANGNGGSELGTLTLRGNIFARGDVGSNDSLLIRLNNVGSNASLIDGGMVDNNALCAENTSSGPSWTEWIETGAPAQTNFDPTAQQLSGAVGSCPDATIFDY